MTYTDKMYWTLFAMAYGFAGVFTSSAFGFYHISAKEEFILKYWICGAVFGIVFVVSSFYWQRIGEDLRREKRQKEMEAKNEEY